MPSSAKMLRFGAVACLLQAVLTSAGPRIKIPIIIDLDISTVGRVAYAFLIIFAVLTALLFLFMGMRVFGVQVEELPPGVTPEKYATGHLYRFLAFLATGSWLGHLITYALYVKSADKVDGGLNRGAFPDATYITRHILDQLTDFFMAASVLQLFYYRRREIHKALIPPFSPLKKMLDGGLLVLHIVAIVCTSVFLNASIVGFFSLSKYNTWLISYYVYTAVYALGVINVMVAASSSRKSVKENNIVDEPRKSASMAPGSMCMHAIFKIIGAIIYSQYVNESINYGIFRIFEVIILGITYLFAMASLSIAGTLNKDDEKMMKALKEKEKQAAAEAQVLTTGTPANHV